MAEKKNENLNNTNETTAIDLKAMLDKAFVAMNPKDVAKMVYVIERGYTMKVAKEEMLQVVRLADSFEMIDTLIDFYQFLKKEEHGGDLFMDLVRTGYSWSYKARSQRVIEELKSSLKAGVEVDFLRKCVERFDDDEDSLITACKIMQKVIRGGDYAADQIATLIMLSHDMKTMKVVMNLLERGSMIEEVEAILVRYRNSASSQYTMLSREVLKRRLAGTVRDEFRFL